MSTNKLQFALEELRAVLLIQQPFFAVVMFEAMETVVVPPEHEITTAATDGHRIYINEKFFLNLSLPERVFLFCHEIGHAILLHLSRSKVYADQGITPFGTPYLHEIGNAAMDYVVNDMLVDGNIGRMPANGLHDKNIGTSADSFEEVYEKIFKSLPPNQKQMAKQIAQARQQGGQGAGTGQLPGVPGTLDKHLPASTSPGAPTPQQMKRVVAAAADGAKAVGKMPGSIERVIDKLLTPQVDWKEELEKHLCARLGYGATTWSRPNRRRLVVSNTYLPGRAGLQAGHLVFIVDTSGSIGVAEAQVALTETVSICQSAAPERMTVIFCDADIQKVVDIEPLYEDAVGALMEDFKRMPGGGGTDFRPPFKLIEKEGWEPECIVYLTDLYGPLPDARHAELSDKMLWLVTTDQKDVPFGRVVKMNLPKNND
jgi:predicted metal-dependent peptidase